jgi:hypothetical protein
MKTYRHPPAAGTYAEHVTYDGFIRYYPVTEEQIARRHALAAALGFALRQPCTFCTASYPSACTHKPEEHFPCYESVKLHPKGYALTHSTHDQSRSHRALGVSMPPGVRILSWPDVVSVAALAAERVLSGEADAASDEDDEDDEDDEGPPMVEREWLIDRKGGR